MFKTEDEFRKGLVDIFRTMSIKVWRRWHACGEPRIESGSPNTIRPRSLWFHESDHGDSEQDGSY